MNNIKIIKLPVEYQSIEHTVPVKHEEEALCWLWAYPSLLLWQRPITWLYVPVVGNTKWPGDLWGIDSNGDLLIIEAKRCIARDDAFKDFAKYHVDSREEFTANHWEQKWHKHWKAELASSDSIIERPKGKTDGMLPRSNKRHHIQRWPELARIIDQTIRSATYSRNVWDNLHVRANANNPRPYYLGLMIRSNQNERVLTDKAIISAKALQQEVGIDHVFAVSISCERIDKDHGQISCQYLDL